MEKLHHENIIKCFGIYLTQDDGFGLVLEYCEFGTYRSFFSRLKEIAPKIVADELWPLKTRIILDV